MGILAENQIGDPMKPLRIMTLITVSSLLLTACETIQGAGRDITNAGNALESAVN